MKSLFTATSAFALVLIFGLNAFATARTLSPEEFSILAGAEGNEFEKQLLNSDKTSLTYCALEGGSSGANDRSWTVSCEVVYGDSGGAIAFDVELGADGKIAKPRVTFLHLNQRR